MSDIESEGIVFHKAMEYSKQFSDVFFFDIGAERLYPDSTFIDLPGLCGCGQLTTRGALINTDPLSSESGILAFRFVQSGMVKVSVNGEPYVFRSGEVLVTRPDQHVTLTGPECDLPPGSYSWVVLNVGMDPDHYLWPKWLNLPPAFLKAFERKIKESPLCQIAVKQELDYFPYHFRQIFERHRNCPESFKLSLAYTIGGLFLELYDLLYRMKVDRVGNPPRVSLLETVIQSLETRYQDVNVSIDLLAFEAKMSRTRFCREFSRATGTTPRQYIIRLRLREARKLIQETNLSGEEISRRIGFLSYSRLFTLLKRYDGVSISELRAKR